MKMDLKMTAEEGGHWAMLVMTAEQSPPDVTSDDGEEAGTGGLTMERALVARVSGTWWGLETLSHFSLLGACLGPTFSPDPLQSTFRTRSLFSPSYPSVTISACCPAPGRVSISFGVPRSYIKS